MATTITGTSGNDVLSGDTNPGDLNDVIYGLAGNDTLSGGAGDDVLRPGTGQDTLVGGAGFDTVVLDSGASFDFVSSPVFNNISGTLSSLGNDGLKYYTGIERILLPGPGLTVELPIAPTPGDDVIRTNFNLGTELLLYGGDGNDRIEPGPNRANVYGEGGDDVIVGARPAAYYGGDGNDRIAATAGVSGTANFFGGNGNDLLETGVMGGEAHGEAGDDTLIATGPAGGGAFLYGEAGNDRIVGWRGYGGDGDDRMETSSQSGYFDGGSGQDIWLVDGTGGGFAIVLYDNLRPAGFVQVGTRFYDFADVETIVFQQDGVTIDLAALRPTDAAETIVGQSLSEVLGGAGGDDTVYGNGGRDWLYGGTGDDRLFGGDGNDDIYGEDGNDWIDGGTGYGNYYGGAGDDTILAEGASSRLYGGDGNDRLSSSLGQDWIYGEAGDDTILGNASWDSIDGGTGYDIGEYAGAYASYRPGVNMADASWTVRSAVPFASGDVLRNVEELRFPDAGVTLTFARFQSTAGNDVIGDLPGSDVLMGGAGDDLIRVSGGGDEIHGGAGYDWVSFASANGGITQTVLYQDGLIVLSGVAGAIVRDVEALAGTAYRDVLELGAGNNRILGYGGDDDLTDKLGNNILEGGAGNDRLEAGAGNDRLLGGTGIDTASYESIFAPVTVNLALTGAQNTGGGGTDTLLDIENVTGGRGNDTLIGTAGNNALRGGDGQDLLYGGLGDDVLDGGPAYLDFYRYSYGDWVSYSLAGAAVTVSLATGLASGGEGNDTLIGVENLTGSAHADIMAGNDFGNRLIGYGGNDAISGAGGVDRLEGGPGADRLNGGAGADELYLGAGDGAIDTLVYAALAEGGDTVREFAAGAGGDRFDVSAFVTGFGGDAAAAMAAGRIVLSAAGADTLVRIDPDGPGGVAATTLATVIGVAPGAFAAANFLVA